MQELKNCPFCGASGDEVAMHKEVDSCEWFVRCYVCHVETCREETDVDAITTWNRRAPVEQAPEWLPIEAAPKDKRILVWTGQERYAAHWAQNPFTGDEAWIVAEWGDDRDQALVKPTHWAELIAAPSAPGREV